MKTEKEILENKIIIQQLKLSNLMNDYFKAKAEQEKRLETVGDLNNGIDSMNAALEKLNSGKTLMTADETDHFCGIFIKDTPLLTEILNSKKH